MTKRRLRKPIRKYMWITSQASQARKPESWKRPSSSPTAAPLPIVAKLPLSR